MNEEKDYVCMDFGDAIKTLERGRKVTRKGWNGKNIYIYLVKTELPYPPLKENYKWEEGQFGLSEFIVMKTADDKLIPWLASQTDLLACDWITRD